MRVAWSGISLATSAQRRATQNFSGRADPGWIMTKLSPRFSFRDYRGGPGFETRWQGQMDAAGGMMYAERREQRKVMIDRVHEEDPRGNKLVITQLAQRLAPDRVVANPLLCAGEQGQKSRPIRAREIETVIELCRREGDPLRRIRDPSPRDKSAIQSRNRGQQFARSVRDSKGDSCLGKVLPQSRDRRHGQDQVADPFELDEENVQPPPSAPAASPLRKRRAGARGNGPT